MVLGMIAVSACHPRPMEDLALADLAVKAAQKAKADSLAPDTYRKAENFYLRAKKDYSDGYYDSAKKYANEARLSAEQAEYQALLKQTQLKGKPEDDARPSTGAGGTPPSPFGSEPQPDPQ
jgi:hypothetical protein